MHEVRENVGSNIEGNYEDGYPRINQGTTAVAENADPNVVNCGAVGPASFGDPIFLMGKGDKGAHRKGGIKPIYRKAKAHIVPGHPPVESRPKKRSRWDIEDPAPGFGFVGFTDPHNNGGQSENPTPAPEVEVAFSMPISFRVW
ncbi:hypothetical protein Hanom_Chr13g01183191 [Helianthus anomalus]